MDVNKWYLEQLKHVVPLKMHKTVCALHINIIHIILILSFDHKFIIIIIITIIITNFAIIIILNLVLHLVQCTQNRWIPHDLLFSWDSAEFGGAGDDDNIIGADCDDYDAIGADYFGDYDYAGGYEDEDTMLFLVMTKNSGLFLRWSKAIMTEFFNPSKNIW